jgi:hypothetical protein
VSGHQHEPWQLLDSAKGGKYCGACGEHIDPQPFTLGQRVRFTDRLVRVHIPTYYNSDRGKELLQEALDLMGTSRPKHFRFHDLYWKLWVPESFAQKHLHSGLTMLNWTYDVPTAGEGVITRKVSLQQGGRIYLGDEEGSGWAGHGTTSAYQISHALHRKPVHVLPEHITALDG